MYVIMDPGDNDRTEKGTNLGKEKNGSLHFKPSETNGKLGNTIVRVQPAPRSNDHSYCRDVDDKKKKEQKGPAPERERGRPHPLTLKGASHIGHNSFSVVEDRGKRNAPHNLLSTIHLFGGIPRKVQSINS